MTPTSHTDPLDNAGGGPGGGGAAAGAGPGRGRPWRYGSTVAPASPRIDPGELRGLLHQIVAAGAPGAAARIRDEHGVTQAASGVADLRSRPAEPGLAALSGWQRDQAVRCDRDVAARRRGPAVAARTPWSAGSRASCHTATRSPFASCSTTPAASPTTRWSRSCGCTRPTGTVPSLAPAGAGRADRRPAAGLPAGHRLVVLQHRVRAGRPDRGGGHWPQAWPGAGPAHLPAARAAQHLLPGQPANHPPAVRARPASSLGQEQGRCWTSPSSTRRWPGGGRAGVQPWRPGALLPCVAGRPAAAAPAAGRDDDRRSPPAAGFRLRLGPDRDRHASGAACSAMTAPSLAFSTSRRAPRMAAGRWAS